MSTIIVADEETRRKGESGKIWKWSPDVKTSFTL